ncbi:MAG: diguanylate cyclase [Helicobacteraceae bacterium]|jgi:diguanylate cyclase (GGDEF)-like protein/PAS domain S-box-containing protein|nr:diguanylate cyclase [Helicobacteraceae bacterium]
MNKLRILIVDDDKITTNILANMLENEQRHVVTCNSGSEALATYYNQVFDIILSDINMPQMSGLELIKKIRKHDKKIKIAIFTNFDNKQHMLTAIEYGVNQFFSKPFQKEHFLDVINNLSNEILALRTTENELNRQQNILHAIKEMSEKLLQHDDWNETLHQQMKMLKDAADASSIFIFDNINTKNPIMAQRHLSINDNYEAFTPNTLHYRELNLQDWKDRLSDNECIHGFIDDFNKEQQSLLNAYKIKALLMLPIFANGTWWGFMGIGTHQRKLFDQSSLEMLQTVARIIGSAVNNHRNLRNYEIRSAMFEHTVDGIVLTSVKNGIINVNKAFTNITGFTKDDVLGKDPKLLKSSIHDKLFYSQMWEQINNEGYWQGEIKNRRKNGETYIEWLSITAIKDVKGTVQNYMGIFSDVTAHRSSELEYAHLATHDSLTGLANRVLLEDRLCQALNHAKRYNKSVAVIFCDLDNFKPINDTYGHMAGDLALKTCSDYFCSVVRAEDTVSRYGGDEFVIILGDIEETDEITSVAEKILNIINVPFDINENKLSLQMSAGISYYPRDGDNTIELVQKADQAMYQAKKEGKNRFFYYSEPSQESLNLNIPIMSVETYASIL